jgi:signal transduction histidine kinase
MLPLVRRCAPVEAMLARLGAGTEAVRVVDAGGWLRAAVGGGDGVPPARPDDPLLREALAGRSVSARRHIRYSGAQTLLVAAPVHAGGRVIGAVLVEQDSARVLGLQLHVFESVALASLGAMGLALGALLLFAWRLTWRIRRLGAETGRAIDPHGRVQADGVRHEVRAADELGDLARHISDMLRRLRRYTGFLERMPRTLRHEIDNPLNVIATSLHNYREQAPGTVGDTYLDSADRAVRRLGHIVRGMTEAASLEDELRRDPRVPLDLAALVSAYAESAAALHPACTVTYAGPAQGVTVTGSDLRLEQLLDKLLDNALDFTPKGGGIRFRLAPELGAVCLEVDNDGPPIPPAVAGSLFESMVSARAAPAPERPHLGLGLYLARLIAESHGGHITAATRADGGGVVFSVWIPAQ